MLHGIPPISHLRIFIVESNVGEKNNIDVIVHTSDVETNIINNETPSITFPVSNSITLPEDPTFEFHREENRTSNITENTSNVDTNIPISIPPKIVQTMISATRTHNVEVDVSKFQSKKGLNIKEGGSGSLTFKPIATAEAKNKVKCIKPSEEEKKILEELKKEKWKQRNS
ncbi:unnamed protein product [Lactuca saligna]|uniref:Uncharacterized protein n=1 Tax=Lactuca saligna TaxID=75948 RepID=A0AA36E9N6_LACSI|nr:unnamed protein product [Lactuca saligna]